MVLDYDNESVITLIFNYRENYATAIQKVCWSFFGGLDIIIGALAWEGSGSAATCVDTRQIECPPGHTLVML